MQLILLLNEVPKEEHINFCNYIIQELKSLFEKSFNNQQVIKLEEYINSYNNINQIIPKKAYYSVHDLYRLALESLKINKIDTNIYQIEIDKNIVIPNSYNDLYSIISLFEYGTLSVKKYGLLDTCMNMIANNLTDYYMKYLGAK